MPIIPDEKGASFFDRTIGLDAMPEAQTTTFKDRLGAAYRLENTIGSMLNQADNLPDGAKATDFDVWANLSDDEKLDSAFIDNALYVDNLDELEAVRKQRSREMRDRQMLAEGGLMETLIASFADPINMIPVGGTAYTSYRTGASILTNAMATATAAASATAITEAELHRTQLTRTFGESAANVTAATFLGGVLGATPGTISKLFSPEDLTAVEKSMDPESVIAAGGNSTLTDASISAAKVDTDAQIRGKFARIVAKSIAMDPLTRTITSENASTRSAVNALAENPLDMDAPLRTSVESAIKAHDGKYFEAVEGHTQAFKAYKEAGGTLKYRDFNEEVGKAMRNGSDDPNIQAAADSWRSKLYDPMKQEAIDQKLLPEDVDVATADEYLNRVWNKEKVAANMPEFVTITSKWLDDQIAVNKDIQAKVADVYERVKNATDTAKIANDIAELEELISGWQGKTAKAVTKAAEARVSEVPTKLTKALDQAATKIINRDLDVDTEDLAREIAGRIMGTPDGRLPYDYKIGQKGTGVVDDKVAGVFKERSFKIPDSMVDKFLENDIETLGARYLKQVAPDVEFMKRFGDVEMKAEIKKIEQDYDFMMQNAKTEKERLKIAKQREADIRDIAAMRDRLRGRYNIADANNIWVRMGRVARDLNYMRLLGGVVAASIPDVARVVGAEGIAKTFSAGLKPLVTNLKGFKLAAREAKLYGIGIDALMNGRAEVIADVADYAKGGTAFERGVRAAANKFSQINLMNHWTSGIKQLHAVTVQTRIGDDLAKGKYDKRLGQLGISEADAKNIAAELKKYGRKDDGVWIYNTRDWDSQDLAMMWGAALRKESDRVIIMPGQEKPLFMSTELGKTIFQFKTFMFSATNRILLSTLQGQDKHFIQGVIGMVSMGMLSYAFKQWDAGRPISDDPKAWVAEGIDRSGVLGILMEANNTMEKISGNTYGLRPMLGVSAPASRYASRSALDSAVGPTFGLAGELVKIMGAATDQREWTEADTRALRRLLPGQNLSILRQGLDEVEKVIAD